MVNYVWRAVSTRGWLCVCVWTMTFLGVRHQQRSGCRTWTKGKVCLSWWGPIKEEWECNLWSCYQDQMPLSRSNAHFVCSFSCCNELMGEIARPCRRIGLEMASVPWYFGLSDLLKGTALLFCGQQELDVTQPSNCVKQWKYCWHAYLNGCNFLLWWSLSHLEEWCLTY